MITINNQSFVHATQLQNHERFSSGRGPRPVNEPNQSRSFESMLRKTNKQPTRNLQQDQSPSPKELLEEAQKQQRENLYAQQNIQTLLIRRRSPPPIDLQSEVGAKALHDLQQITGPLTHQQVKTLRSDIANSISLRMRPDIFETKQDQLDLAVFLDNNFGVLAGADGKPGLSAQDIRQTAARGGNPNILSNADVLPRNSNNAQSLYLSALRGERTIDLQSGVGAKALRDLQNTIGPLTRQQMQNLKNDLSRSVSHTVNTNPSALTSTQLDQLSLASLMLQNFDRNAGQDGRPGFSATDLRLTAARAGIPTALSKQDVL